ncbi:MAG: cysteine--tRNA ligase, partial [Candidatus Heimdallarchaeota archaeon]|nr:cysteine--tRNA ligase [Candidatus Heimdallarchaeota archaeon]
MIKIYNTLTRQLEEFTTLEPNVVSFYNCGPTVNGLMHLGHARSAIAFD